MGDPEAAAAEVGRELLDGPLDEYVARRKVVARRLREAGDREAAKVVDALGKPTVVMFAVLRAADDADAVRAAVEATAEVARVQTGAADRAALSEATAERRARIDDLVEAGLAAASDGGGPNRADEVRSAIDLLTRHDEVLDTWLSGTLRALPVSDAGFGALGLASVFADTGPSARSGTARSRRSKPSGAKATAANGRGDRATDDEATTQPTAAQRRARAAAEKALATATAQEERTGAALDAAREAAVAADDTVADAQRALADAEDRARRAAVVVAAADDERTRASRAVEQAQAALDALD